MSTNRGNVSVKNAYMGPLPQGTPPAGVPESALPTTSEPSTPDTRYADAPRPYSPGLSKKGPASLVVPPYGIGLENSLTHQAGSFTPQASAYSTRYGWTGTYLRTTPFQPARVTDGQIYKQTYMGEEPFRQNYNKLVGQTVISSPGKMPNTPQYTAQDVLILQALRARGVIK